MTSLNTQTKNKRILKALSPILIIEENKEDKLISVSIAIIIDNAESLFGEEIKKLNCIHKIQRDDCELCIKNQSYEIIKEGWRNQSHEILSMCLNNKPLKEIEDYIIKNIK